MYVLRGLFTIYQRCDVGMVQTLQDGDFAAQVVSELLVKFAHVHRLDSYEGFDAIRVLRRR